MKRMKLQWGKKKFKNSSTYTGNTTFSNFGYNDNKSIKEEI